MKTNQINSCPVPNGVLLIIGGHENKDGKPEKKVHEGDHDPREILETFIKLTGKTEPVLEIITSASSDGKASFHDYKKAFNQLGVNQVGHIHHDERRDALADELMERISRADGVFLAGGDQLKLTSMYGGTPLFLRIKQRYLFEKLVLAGTSAGAMAMSTPMIYAGNKHVQQITGEVKITTGLEFLKDVCIDTHFVDRARFVRMAQVIATNPASIGIGIEQDTALIVRKGVEAEVIGSGVVIVIEGFGITRTNVLEFAADQTISIRDLNVHVLGKGSPYVIPQTNPPHI